MIIFGTLMFDIPISTLINFYNKGKIKDPVKSAYWNKFFPSWMSGVERPHNHFRTLMFDIPISTLINFYNKGKIKDPVKLAYWNKFVSSWKSGFNKTS